MFGFYIHECKCISGMRIITENIFNLFIFMLKLNDLSILSMKEILINLHSY